MTGARKRLLLIELNEFSVALFERGIGELDLPSIRKLLGMAATATTTDDRVEHHGLDPWVQWVSIHTGQAASVHGILHLGDAPGKLGRRQIWEALSGRGISSGIWGAMNAVRGDAKLCSFFLPDPWTFSEPAYPEKLGDLLALPRYYSRNYLDVSPWQFLKGSVRLARYVLTSGALGQLLALAPLIMRGLLANGINNPMLFSLFDLFSATLFVARRKLDSPQFSLIFLNSIAHIQHHRWKNDERMNNDLRFALLAIDKVLALLFSSLRDGEAVVVMNALTQKNVSEGKPLFAYRQINPGKFLKAAGFEYARVEQLMTNDAHVFFHTQAQRDLALSAIEAAEVNGSVLFQAEADPDSGLKLFYQIVLWDEFPADAVVRINGLAIAFFEHFGIIAIRTGAHIPEGQVFSEGLALPARMHNHQMFAHLLEYFGAGDSELCEMDSWPEVKHG